LESTSPSDTDSDHNSVAVHVLFVSPVWAMATTELLATNATKMNTILSTLEN
jgi:hypothetical protein